jgi:peptide/nickel transport system permease protein
MLMLWLTLTLLFLLLALVKGNPIELYLDPRLSQAQRQNLARAYGYDRSRVEQYFHYLVNIPRGELGLSFSFKRPVREVLAERIGPSLGLGLAGYLSGLILSGFLLAGLAQTRRPLLRGTCDRLRQVLLAVPGFVVATLLLGLLTRYWPLFPAFGSRNLFAENRGFWDMLHHAVLPVLSLALPVAGTFTTYLSERMRDLDDAPFVISARGRGVAETRIFWNHKLRQLMPDLVQLLGLYLPTVAGGALVIEALFGWSGMGLLMFDAVFDRDFPLLVGGTLWTVLLVVPAYELADHWRASRVRRDERGFHV